jgi:3D (Asp-Asp-Asp) domain-containing protein
MCLCRRSALWAGCLILVLVFVAAEELADATSAAPVVTEPIAQQYSDDDFDWDDSATEPQAEAEFATEGGELSTTADSAAPSAAAHNTKPLLEHRSSSRTVQRVCRVTAYCDRGLTAAGVNSGVGQCAAPADIPLGSVVYIPVLQRKFVVTDRTHRRFRHNTVDLFIPSEAQCRKFGRRYLDCEFTLVKEAVRYGELRVARGG